MQQINTSQLNQILLYKIYGILLYNNKKGRTQKIGRGPVSYWHEMGKMWNFLQVSMDLENA